MAPIDAPRRATQHQHYRLAAKIPRAQPGRKRLADRMFVVGAYAARPRYATSEDCVGWADAEPHA